jgi:YD repeat-containing protein
MRRIAYVLGTAAGALALGGTGAASETTSYSYDALGRLVAVATAGGPNDGLAVATAYDPAGNRSSYSVGGGTPPPPPPPPPPPGNQPPTPAADSGSQERCTTAVYDVAANDTDPDGDYPLTVVSVTGAGFSVASASSVQFVSGSTTGAKVGTYTVQDSRGATATATLTVNVSGGVCQ